MKCEKCSVEMVKCEHGIIVGSLKKGVKLSLCKCPKCGCLKHEEEKVKF